MRFEWDPDKDRINRRKHGVSLADAEELLAGSADYLEIYDADHSVLEDRFVAIGATRRGVLVVVYTERLDDITRIVSVRRATSRETKMFNDFCEGRRG